jgi:hypothetical protein
MLRGAAETARQAEARLLRVIAQARFDVLPDDYVWEPMNAGEPPAATAIGCVRDGHAWHQFVAAPAGAPGRRYRVVSFHFGEQTDASGFVAWLAGQLKRRAGTGSVVICGKDRRDSTELFRTCQGVFDYWCCSVDRGDRLVAVIQALIARGQKH